MLRTAPPSVCRPRPASSQQIPRTLIIPPGPADYSESTPCSKESSSRPIEMKVLVIPHVEKRVQT